MRLTAYRRVVACDMPQAFSARLREHLTAISHPERRAASLCAWDLLYKVLLRQGMGEYMERVRFTERGKPVFETGDLHFSISHSGSLCALSLADVPTGVDVERVKRDRSTPLVEKTLTDGERAVYDGDFTRLWCRKESLAKLTGRGMAGHPSRIDTLDRSYSFSEYDLSVGETDYRLAAAFLGGAEPVILLEL